MLTVQAADSVPQRRNLLFPAFRLLFGPRTTVAAGSTLLALLFPVAAPVAPASHALEDWGKGLLGVMATTVVLGLLSGPPCRALGLFAFGHCLPRRMCPAAAMATIGLTLGGLSRWVNAETSPATLFTLPSGRAAAHLFGAIGLGYPSGKWRSDVRAA